jgi:hypothetical protein
MQWENISIPKDWMGREKCEQKGEEEEEKPRAPYLAWGSEDGCASAVG